MRLSCNLPETWEVTEASADCFQFEWIIQEEKYLATVLDRNQFDEE